MLYLYVFIILQIVVESLPISSSGHTTLFSCLMFHFGHQLPEIVTAVWFNHLLHLPTVFIIVLFFEKQWSRLACHPWRYKKIIVRLVGMVFVADAITMVFYGFFKYIGVHWFPLGIGFLITAFLLYSLRYCPSGPRIHSLLFSALILGMVQGAALLPGISRFAATYVGARWLSIDAQKSLYLSWLLQWPLIVVGSLHGLVGLYLYGLSPELLHPMLWLVIIGASIAAWYGLRLVYHMAIAHQLYKWSLYMLIPFLIWLFLIMSIIVHKENL